MSHDISSLRKFVSPEIVFGAGSRKSVANFASNFGARHVFLVSDPGVAAAGWVNEIVTLLTDSGIRSTIYTGVSPNPKVDEVMTGADPTNPVNVMSSWPSVAVAPWTAPRASVL